jgi:AraC-like DNA-binding protein
MKVSRATCNRLFRKSVGQSCKSFLIKVRISHASRMLLETDRNIIDISWRCGFSNLSNFNRQFKALKGASPRQFRRKSREPGAGG